MNKDGVETRTNGDVFWIDWNASLWYYVNESLFRIDMLENGNVWPTFSEILQWRVKKLSS
jgi:hypothetical protein